MFIDAPLTKKFILPPEYRCSNFAFTGIAIYLCVCDFVS